MQFRDPQSANNLKLEVGSNQSLVQTQATKISLNETKSFEIEYKLVALTLQSQPTQSLLQTIKTRVMRG